MCPASDLVCLSVLVMGDLLILWDLRSIKELGGFHTLKHLALCQGEAAGMFFILVTKSHILQNHTSAYRKMHKQTRCVTFTALLVRSEFIARVTGTLEAAESVYTPLLTATIVWLGTLILLWKTHVRALEFTREKHFW